jgi:hypothetical protein
MGNLGRFWLSCLGPVGFQLRKTFKILVQLLALGVIDECYSRTNTSTSLIQISSHRMDEIFPQDDG